MARVQSSSLTSSIVSERNRRMSSSHAACLNSSPALAPSHLMSLGTRSNHMSAIDGCRISETASMVSRMRTPWSPRARGAESSVSQRAISAWGLGRLTEWSKSM
eukprot:Amastigsp_a515780_3.p6 type:complete len:104 gc:universal Amastigsp_a515780_3:768-457(-)